VGAERRRQACALLCVHVSLLCVHTAHTCTRLTAVSVCALLCVHVAGCLCTCTAARAGRCSQA
jgi:hypothetical protein